MVRALKRFMDDSHKWLTRVLEVGREQGEMKFTGDPAQRAWTLLASLQGARQLARLQGAEIIDTIIDDVKVQLGIK